MVKTLVLVFHPDFKESRANKALVKNITELPGVETFDVQAAYPDNVIDTDKEVARLLAADRIVFQFPIQWYSAPPILQAWQNAVLTRMYYINYENEGRLLEGKPLLLAVTAGNTPSAYTTGGANIMPLQEILNPLRVTANRCGLQWSDPFIVYEAMKASDEQLRVVAERYRNWLFSGNDEPDIQTHQSQALAAL
ncbi:NAD(P)H-dependent oxidoreductase [Phyllobacterium sp. YR531]|uniref:NAD(P)H-dependent oxidoreductase n=1 Tax=Phyllobacterium sp. YR531 TaxID=1144343 RepID=UPI00026FB216|nr:NAD(P)H-dependent oxidoreductase [Phyllobacterium sp. YR531]EJN05462.1 putative NADPH-quinone reductase (modulator of drug activity B) [Phyllobacterium sp. YR531]